MSAIVIRNGLGCQLTCPSPPPYIPVSNLFPCEFHPSFMHNCFKHLLLCRYGELSRWIRGHGNVSSRPDLIDVGQRSSGTRQLVFHFCHHQQYICVTYHPKVDASLRLLL